MICVLKFFAILPIIFNYFLNIFNNMGFLNDFIQFILGLTALFSIIFAIWKVRKPNLQISILSFYNTVLQGGELACVLKIKTNSSADMLIESLKIYALQDDKRNLMKITLLRQKGFLFKMKDSSGMDSNYKLLKPLEPNLQVHGIKSGINEYYVSLKSELEFSGIPDKKIVSWEFEVKGRSPVAIVPGFIKMSIPKITVDHPSDLYFDDSLVEKISEEERNKIIKQL